MSKEQTTEKKVTFRVKKGNMNVFIYGKSKGGSRIVGTKKKRKVKK